jgi:hypothetical protein
LAQLHARDLVNDLSVDAAHLIELGSGFDDLVDGVVFSVVPTGCGKLFFFHLTFKSLCVLLWIIANVVICELVDKISLVFCENLLRDEFRESVQPDLPDYIDLVVHSLQVFLMKAKPFKFLGNTSLGADAAAEVL